MDPFRFDRVTRLFGRATSRREALRSLLAGVLGVAAGAAPGRAAANGGTPAGSGLSCPPGHAVTGGDFAFPDDPVGPPTCCPPERIFRKDEYSEERFCCPAAQVCPRASDPSGFHARCCFAGEVCVAGECCEAGQACGGACCRGGACVGDACVCPSGVACGGACCPTEGGDGAPFCGADYPGMWGACCYGDPTGPIDAVSCLAEGGGGFGRVRP